LIKTMGVVCAAIVPVLLMPQAAGAAGLKAVIFDLEPVEMPDTPKVRARLKQENDLLRKLFADKGFTIVDTAPQAAKIADNLPLSRCNGCDQDIAKALGADIEVATAVQQSSSAIYNLSGSVKDVATNRTLREGVADIRGDNDDTWNHGIRFLTRERLLEPPLPTDTAGLKALVEGLPPVER
jgi:hypothetical protein